MINIQVAQEKQEMRQRKQVDGIQITRTSRTLATLGSFAGATIAMVLLQECSSSTATMVVSAVTARLVLSCLRLRFCKILFT